MRALTWLPLALLVVGGVARGDDSPRGARGGREDVEGRTVDHARLLLGDAVPTVPASMADLDLGPSPPPGGSRLVGRDEMIAAIRRAGLYPNTTLLPSTVRVTSAARHITSTQLATMAAPVISKCLRPGIELKAVEGTSDLVVAPRAEARCASVSGVPYQKGEARANAVVEFTSDHVVVASVPVGIVVDVSESAAHPDVSRGAVISLVIERRSMRISAPGTCAIDANVGDTVVCHVSATGRTLRARIASHDEAVVMEGP